MEQTANYQLSQWDEQDRILREDFNADNVKLEQALAGIAETQESLAEQIAKCGNCKIVSTTYTGTGSYGKTNPTTLTFDAVPEIVMIADTEGSSMLIHHGSVEARPAGSSYYNTVTWDGNTVSWYSTTSNGTQFSMLNRTYFVFAWFVPN